MIVDPRLTNISPLWADVLTRINSVSGLLKKRYVAFRLTTKKLDITDYSFCMIGEANGFDRRYLKTYENGCSDCDKIANAFNVSRKDKNEIEIPRIEKVIVEFCDHVEKYHGVHLS